MLKIVRDAAFVAALAGATSLAALSGATAQTNARGYAPQQGHMLNAAGCVVSRMQVKSSDGALKWKLVEDCNLD
jgi:hypothetical protein